MNDSQKQAFSHMVALIVGAVVAFLSSYFGVKPDAITVPVTVQAVKADDGMLMTEGRPKLFGLRAKLHAEIDRRAGLPTDHVWHLAPEKAQDAHAFVGKLGDGQLLELLIRYGPDIIALVIKILGLMAVL